MSRHQVHLHTDDQLDALIESLGRRLDADSAHLVAALDERDRRDRGPVAGALALTPAAVAWLAAGEDAPGALAH